MGGNPLLKVLVLGANGQLGRALQKSYNNSNIILTALPKEICDVTNHSDVNKYITKEKYDCVINAAAYTDVQNAEKNKDLSKKINCDALKNICSAILDKKSLLVHFSTDYVFDGGTGRAYLEDDNTNPINQYGISKLNGERVIENSGINYLIFRTSWVYDNYSINFPNKIIEMLKSKEAIKVVDDQIGTPNHVDFIAKATFACIEKYYNFNQAERIKAHGTYHMSSTGQTSWFSFAKFITKNYYIKLPHNEQTDIIPIKTGERSDYVKRPLFSVLDSTKICNVFDIRLPTWQDGACNFIKSKT